jgi:predicted metal-dependent enzyme (double-stranded beta helix superfamily)
MSGASSAFEAFVSALREIWRAYPDDETRMTKAREPLRALALNPEIQAHSRSWPFTVGQNLLLHEDAEYGFVVNAVARPPGYKGGVHDHANAWVLYGVVDGAESLERYQREDDGAVEGYAQVRMLSASRGVPGVVDIVPPFEIHAEQGASDRSAALIVRSQRVVGRVMQNGYNPVEKTVVKRWGPEQVPYSLS